MGTTCTFVCLWPHVITVFGDVGHLTGEEIDSKPGVNDRHTGQTMTIDMLHARVGFGVSYQNKNIYF